MATPNKAGRPARTSRAAILRAARELIERDGWERLTMRKLATVVGIAPTTLYHHVRDKDELLIELLRDYAEGIPRPELPEEPRERIVTAAIVMHDALAAWPWLAEVLTADAVIGEPALWIPETIVDTAITRGCTTEQAVRLYRAIWYYTVGEILVRANASTAGAVRAGGEQRTGVFADLDAEAFPRLAAIGPRWLELTGEDSYREGLRAFVRGLLPE